MRAFFCGTSPWSATRLAAAQEKHQLATMHAAGAPAPPTHRLVLAAIPTLPKAGTPSKLRAHCGSGSRAERRCATGGQAALQRAWPQAGRCSDKAGSKQQRMHVQSQAQAGRLQAHRIRSAVPTAGGRARAGGSAQHSELGRVLPPQTRNGLPHTSSGRTAHARQEPCSQRPPPQQPGHSFASPARVCLALERETRIAPPLPLLPVRSAPCTRHPCRRGRAPRRLPRPTWLLNSCGPSSCCRSSTGSSTSQHFWVKVLSGMGSGAGTTSGVSTSYTWEMGQTRAVRRMREQQGGRVERGAAGWAWMGASALRALQGGAARCGGVPESNAAWAGRSRSASRLRSAPGVLPARFVYMLRGGAKRWQADARTTRCPHSRHLLGGAARAVRRGAPTPPPSSGRPGCESGPGSARKGLSAPSMRCARRLRGLCLAGGQARSCCRRGERARWHVRCRSCYPRRFTGLLSPARESSGGF